MPTYKTTQDMVAKKLAKGGLLGNGFSVKMNKPDKDGNIKLNVEVLNASVTVPNIEIFVKAIKE